MLALGVVLLTGLACPTAADVHQAIVERQGAERAPQLEQIIVVLDPSAHEVAIELRTPRGTMGRRLPLLPDCAATTLIVATVVAAWQTQLADPALVLPSMPRPPSSTSPAPPATIAAPSPRAISVAYDLSGGFLASFAGSAFAAGGFAEVRLGRRPSGLGGYLGVEGTGLRTLSVGLGTAAWTHVGPRLGVGYRYEGRRLGVEGVATLTLAALLLSSRAQFEPLHRAEADVGLGAAIRVGVRAGRVRPFVGLGVGGWLRRFVPFVATQPTIAREIPRFEVLVSVGVSLVSRR